VGNAHALFWLIFDEGLKHVEASSSARAKLRDFARPPSLGWSNRLAVQCGFWVNRARRVLHDEAYG
jgi:hypothetical protein